MSQSLRSKRQKFRSNLAACKALRRISMELIEQLDLFNTSVHLHKIEGLNLFEMEKLGNSHITELERKQYLVTTVLPSKGHYKGMRLLRRALKKSKQDEIVNMLDKAYEGAIIAERLRLSQTPEVKHETGTMSHHPVLPPTICIDGHSDVNISISTSSSDTDDDDGDDIISLDSPVEQQQPLPSYVDVKFQLPLSQDSRTTISVTPSPHRQRANHISHRSNPFKANTTQPEQALSVIMSEIDRLTESPIHATDTLRSVNKLPCDLPVMKFVFVGDVGTGKTSLLERYINNKFSSAVEPTILIDFKSTEVTCYNTRYKLHLWDTVGQERFKAITNAYYRDAVGGFVVYDVTQRTTLDHCLQWKKEIDDVVQLSNGDPIPIVLIANKTDCGRLDGEQFSKESGFAGYFETSAKTGAGVKEAIYFMVKKVHELSCAHQEPVVRTLSRSRAASIKLEFNKDNGRNHNHCCTYRSKRKYAEQRSTVVETFSKDEETILHKKPDVESRSAAILQSSKSSLSSPSTPVEQQVTTSVHPPIAIGEKVMVDTPNGFKFGKIKFVGSTEFAAGEWIADLL